MDEQKGRAPFRLRLPEEITISAIKAEVTRARLKFPGNRFLLAALTEEVGELARALLQRRPREEWEREAIQVACVAVRIIEEGDATFDDVTSAEAKP
jgi:NTP pyrophosphatase (non-canonical NTP hydrolase)